MPPEAFVTVELWSSTTDRKMTMLCSQTNCDHAAIPSVGDPILLRHIARRKDYRPTISKLVYDDTRDIYKLILDYTHNHNYSTNYVCASLDLTGDEINDHHRRHELELWATNL